MTQTPFYHPINVSRLEGTTLVVPAVSIGSVPQLAVDLLLHDSSLRLVKVGRLDPSFCFPFVGPSEPGSTDDITTALEVFSNGSLTVIQQRSPVYKSLDRAYVAALTTWIHESKFSEVLWLTSIDAAARTDAEFATPVLSLFPSSSSEVSTPVLSEVQSRFPRFNPSEPQTAYTESSANEHQHQQQQEKDVTLPHIPGSLLTRKLLHHAAQSELKHRFGALLYFAAEGDTRSDAHALASLVLSLLHHSGSSPNPTESLKEPASWSALFGRPAASALYA